MNFTELLSGPLSVSPLSPGLIHLWSFSTALPSDILAALEQPLVSDERTRAARFHFERDRRSFIVCRGLLRILLGGYLHEEPSAIGFSFGPHGKPALTNPLSPQLHFSVSHSGERGLLAFLLDRNVGVDVEFQRDDVDFAALAQRFFSEIECANVLALPPSHRSPLFYEYWSCKEACIKADGRGLSISLDGFSIVPLEPLEGDAQQRPEWRKVLISGANSVDPNLHIFIPPAPPGYSAAVAAPGPIWSISQFHLESALA